MISKHLDELSNNSHIFDYSKKPYKQVLIDSGHNLNQYTDRSQNTNKKRRKIKEDKLYISTLLLSTN